MRRGNSAYAGEEGRNRPEASGRVDISAASCTQEALNGLGGDCVRDRRKFARAQAGGMPPL